MNNPVNILIVIVLVSISCLLFYLGVRLITSKATFGKTNSNSNTNNTDNNYNNRSSFPLLNTKWKVTSMNSSNIKKYNPTMNFTDDSDNKGQGIPFSGNAGCNNYFGSFILLQNGSYSGMKPLKVSPIGSTKKMCADDEQMKVEYTFLKNISNVSYYSIQNTTLGLYDSNKNLIITLTKQ